MPAFQEHREAAPKGERASLSGRGVWGRQGGLALPELSWELLPARGHHAWRAWTEACCLGAAGGAASGRALAQGEGCGLAATHPCWGCGTRAASAPQGCRGPRCLLRPWQRPWRPGMAPCGRLQAPAPRCRGATCAPHGQTCVGEREEGGGGGGGAGALPGTLRVGLPALMRCSSTRRHPASAASGPPLRPRTKQCPPRAPSSTVLLPAAARGEPGLPACLPACLHPPTLLT
jgi:hypothetical protein